MAEGPRLGLHQCDPALPQFSSFVEVDDLSTDHLAQGTIEDIAPLGLSVSCLPQTIAFLAVARLQQICLSRGIITFVAEQTTQLLFKHALPGSLFLFMFLAG